MISHPSLSPLASPIFSSDLIDQPSGFRSERPYSKRDSFLKSQPSLSPTHGSKSEIPNSPLKPTVKSPREATLFIFKAKDLNMKKLQEKEAVRFTKLVNINNTRENNTDKAVLEALAQNQEKLRHKTNQKYVGTMFLNDLWGKQYEYTVRKASRIDAELKKQEKIKRSTHEHARLTPVLTSIDRKTFDPRHQSSHDITQKSPRSKVFFNEIGRSWDLGLTIKTDRPITTTVTESGMDAPLHTKEDSSSYLPQISPRRTDLIINSAISMDTIAGAPTKDYEKIDEKEEYVDMLSGRDSVTQTSSKSRNQIRKTRPSLAVFDEVIERRPKKMLTVQNPKAIAQEKAYLNDKKTMIDTLMEKCNIETNRDKKHPGEGHPSRLSPKASGETKVDVFNKEMKHQKRVTTRLMTQFKQSFSQRDRLNK